MMSQELLSLLRCPMDPRFSALVEEDGRLVCQGCRIVFPMRDGFATLLVEEAELPPGCSSPEQLPCQRAKKT